MLKINGITKIFDRGEVTEKCALGGVSLQINEGDFITVIGGNGAGKSTLLNALAGTFFLDGGNITLDDRDISSMPEYKRAAFIGRVFQDPLSGTAGGMNLEENLALANRRGKRRGLGWGVKKAEHNRYRDMLMNLNLGLENSMSQKVNTLSGGQRQALTLLMATMNNPRLLLLDEHTAALDPKTAKRVLDITEALTGEMKLTTLMITHDMKQAIKYGNRLIMMHEGKIAYSIEGEEKKNLQIKDLIERFENSGALTDRMVLQA